MLKIYKNIFKSKKTKTSSEAINVNNYYLVWDKILKELSDQKIISYNYTKSEYNLLMINYMISKNAPLETISRHHPANRGYGEFELKILELYHDMVIRNKIIYFIKFGKFFEIPTEIYVNIYKFIS